MAPRIVRRLPDAQQVAAVAAGEFLRIGTEAIERDGRFTVACAGGSTPQALYWLLATPPYRQQLDWTTVEWFWGDERAVSPDHPDSNFRMVREALLDAINIPAVRVHRIAAERTDHEGVAREYSAEIARVFGVAADGPPPAFDLILLGMGADGHTASLFPHTPALREVRRWVVANPVPALGAERVTFTAPLINDAAAVIFLVVGSEKAPALAAVLEGPPDPERLPAQLIQPEKGLLLWLVDAAAASELARPKAGATA